MIIRQMALRDLNQVISLHKKSLPHTLSSKIGPAYLYALYEDILNCSGTHTCIVVCEGNEIIGVITATTDLRTTQKLLNPIGSLRKIYYIFESLLKKRITMKELFSKLKFEFKLLKKFPSSYATILTLFVNQETRKKGIGTVLVETALQALKKKAVRMVYVDTLRTNTSAFNFYKKIGFKDRGELFDSIILSIEF